MRSRHEPVPTKRPKANIARNFRTLLRPGRARARACVVAAAAVAGGSRELDDHLIMRIIIYYIYTVVYVMHGVHVYNTTYNIRTRIYLYTRTGGVAVDGIARATESITRGRDKRVSSNLCPGKARALINIPDATGPCPLPAIARARCPPPPWGVGRARVRPSTIFRNMIDVLLFCAETPCLYIHTHTHI